MDVLTYGESMRYHEYILYAQEEDHKQSWVDKLINTGIVAADPDSYESIPMDKGSEIPGYDRINYITIKIKDCYTDTVDLWIVAFASREDDEEESGTFQGEMTCRFIRHCDGKKMIWFWH